MSDNTDENKFTELQLSHHMSASLLQKENFNN